MPSRLDRAVHLRLSNSQSRKALPHTIKVSSNVIAEKEVASVDCFKKKSVGTFIYSSCTVDNSNCATKLLVDREAFVKKIKSKSRTGRLILTVSN